MQSENIFIALLCTVLCFFALELIWGSSGLQAYSQRSDAVLTISDNVSALQERNNFLLAEKHLLDTDPEYLLRMASNFAYYSDGQYVIKADQHRRSQDHWEIGRIQYAAISEARNTRSIRAVISLIVGMLGFLLANLLSVNKHSRQFRVEISENSMHHAV